MNFAMTAFSQDEKADPPYAVPYGLQTLYGLSKAQEGGSALEMDGNSEQPKMTAGLNLGDRYSYFCLIDTLSGEVIEEGRLRTTPEAFRRRFSSEQLLLQCSFCSTGSRTQSRIYA